VLLLVAIASAVVLIDSSMDNINESMPEVSKGIVNGDRDYNESVELVNNKYFNDGMDKAESAEDNYNNSLNKLLEIEDKFNKDLNDVHKQYIRAVINEVRLKLKAVDELKQAIGYFQEYSNYTGSTHASEANDYMYESLKFQEERNSIVQNNSEIFKKDFII
jgi:uncharacterized protein YbgA (DUF1722 family)